MVLMPLFGYFGEGGGGRISKDFADLKYRFCAWIGNGRITQSFLAFQKDKDIQTYFIRGVTQSAHMAQKPVNFPEYFPYVC